MKKMHLVSHIHWDPAWYLPYEQYRITLIPAMKEILSMLENDEAFTSFMFDGQVDAIDGYLELFPEDRDRVERLVKNGKLRIGPWYIQPEEFLLSGESHIRNLLLGIQKAKAYGGFMRVSYLCDMVGHIAQMPQIIKGFGLDRFVGWRGIVDGQERNETAYLWQAPDGSEVVLKALVDGYYHRIPADDSGFAEKIGEIYAALEPYEKGNNVLIMQGADHVPAPASTPRLIAEYNKKAGCEAIKQVTLEEHFDAMNTASLKRIRGELRAAYYHGAFMLTGILTARMSIKYKNEHASRELERWAEPFSCVNGWINGARYPAHLLQRAWLKQLKCAFHDCIYGGHVDSVTEDICNDYKRIGEITDWLNGENLFALTQAIQTVGDGDNMTIFNPSPFPMEHASVDFSYLVSETAPGREIAIFTAQGEYLPVQINAIETGVKRYCGFSGNQWEQCSPAICNRYHLTTVVPHIPGFGYVNLGIRRMPVIDQDASEQIRIGKASAGKSDLSLSGNVCENHFLRVTLCENGCLSVFDKRSGRLYNSINRIEESGDKGDLYNHSQPYSGGMYLDCHAPCECSIEQQGEGKVTFVTRRRWLLPACVEEENHRSSHLVENTIVTYATVRAFSPVIEFRTVIDNCSKDHRYRLYLPTGIVGEEISSGAQFYVSTRKREEPRPDRYIETPMNNSPQRLFTDISSDKGGIAVFSRGFSEYDARCNGDLYLTMLRCVSHLSKETNAERSYCGAGPGYATPGAQELGKHTIEYALFFHAPQEDVLPACDRFYAPVRCVQGNKYAGSLPAAASYIALWGEGLMLSAVKQSSREGEWIIRVYNARSHRVEGCLALIVPVLEAHKANLAEEHEHPLAIQNGAIVFTVEPYQIYTVALKVKEAEK